jgi:oleate hydratase
MQNTHQSDKTDVSVEPRTTQHNKRKVYFVGSGIAALAGAVFLIRDGLIPGENIHIFEELKLTGGSLDGAGSPD